MSAPPLLPITIQAVVMSVISSVIAQLLSAYQKQTPLVSAFDVEAITKFVVYTALVTPPNVLWQTFLESSLPGTRKAPAGEKAKAKGEKPKESLSIPNTLAKTALDQSIGASVNTFLFCSYMAIWDVLVSQGQFAAGPAAASVVGAAVADRLSTDFVPFMKAGWRFWPWVSLGNFALVQDVATRNLVGGLAGIAWGVYVNLFAAGSAPAPVKEE
ncbi:hypothetical protein Sste5346_006737 [Sporothrix stenoceras]|uniref:Integral membrane protein, Mpv17/PMP22 family n=1 Tax=Sporothrix stenoceras TaxID=5173 RepID=A0ABR3YWY2_9PEZI